MTRFTPKQRLQIVQIYFKNHNSVRETFRALRPFYGRHNRPSEQVIRLTINRFRTRHTLLDNTHPQRRRRARTQEVISAVERSVENDPNESVRHRAQQLELCPSTLWKILRKDIGIKACKDQITLTKKDHSSTNSEKKGRVCPDATSVWMTAVELGR